MLIGILTFHNEINHGAFLQTYCLQETLKNMGHVAHIINYSSNFYLDNHNRSISYQCFNWRYFRNRFYLYSAISTLIKEIKFRYAMHTKLHLTKFSDNIEYTLNQNNYDLIILGSDEIWNFENLGRGLDLTYFGKGIDKCRIISYACSFGSISETREIPEEIVSQLQKISSISVRDNNSLSIIKKCSLNAQKALDPTFLYDVKTSSNEKFKKLENYILIYAGNIENEYIKAIKNYANHNKLNIVAVSYSQSWADINLIGVGIFEWTSLFKHASLVVTNTFHGTIFSVLNQKQFCLVGIGEKSIKIKDLLTEFELLDQIAVAPSNISEIFLRKIDYNNVMSKIEFLKNESLAYLKNELSLKK